MSFTKRAYKELKTYYYTQRSLLWHLLEVDVLMTSSNVMVSTGKKKLGVNSGEFSMATMTKQHVADQHHIAVYSSDVASS